MAQLFGLLAACAGDGPTPDTGTPTVTGPYETVERRFEWTNDFDTDAKFHVPEAAVGMVWAFHGNGGGLPSVQQTEWTVVYNQLVQRGIGVVITKSRDRQTGRWTVEDQDDLVAIFDAMVQTHGVVPDDIPQGVLSFSGGAQMAHMFEDLSARRGWVFRAAAIHQGSVQMTEVPTMYFAAENDDVGRTGAYYDKTGLVEICQESTGDCRLREGTEIQLDPRRFVRLKDVDETRSQAFFDELVALGSVDADGRRLVTFDGEDAVQIELDRFIKASRFGSNATLAAGQLRVVWATHRLSSEFVTEEADFFLSHLQ